MDLLAGLWGMSSSERYREQAERARRWAASIPDPTVRRELETVAKDYEQMAESADCVDAAPRREVHETAKAIGYF